MDGYPRELQLSPAAWPEQCSEPRPGDLKHFVSQGFGMGPPGIMTPYGGMPEGSYYGFDSAGAHPFPNAPLTDSSGGTLYFDGRSAGESLAGALALMGVYDSDDYVAYAASSDNPPEERYLDQLRIVSVNALVSLFETRSSTPPPKQSLKIRGLVPAFIAAQKEKWQDDYTFSAKLRGTAGGDGDWAKESLAFGFHVENTDWGVYRLWSRPWLVTK